MKICERDLSLLKFGILVELVCASRCHFSVQAATEHHPLCGGGQPMDTISIQPWSEQLASDVRTLPDYLIHRVAQLGIGRVESELDVSRLEVVWQYTSRYNGEKVELARSPDRLFRMVLARWAALLGTDPYCSQKVFAVSPHSAWPSAGVHRFSFYLCNEPTMAIWFKLYLYCIDGVWPTPRSQ
jgi:hypothetical protein